MQSERLCDAALALSEHAAIGRGNGFATTRSIREPAVRTVPFAVKLHSNPGRECELKERLQATLQSSPYPHVRRIRCEFEEGLLTLRGTVPSYHCVQVAIHLVRAASNSNLAIRNCLRVVHTRRE